MRKASLVLTTVLCFLAALFLGPGPASAKDPIVIGAIVELTGEAAEMGIENQQTIEVAETLLNEAGGVHGYPLKVVIVDGGSDPAVFATKAHRLLEDNKVIAGIGGNDISFATAAGEVFAKAKTPYADIGGTTPTIPLISEYMFMAPGPDNDQGRAVAKYLAETLKYDTVAIFKDVASSYGTKLTEYIIHYLKIFTKKDNPAPLVLEYQTGDTDYSAQLTRLKAEMGQAGVQAIILPTWPQDAPTIAKQARDLGIDLPLVGTDGVDTSALTEVGGAAVEGIVYSTHFHPDQPGLPDMAKKFVEKFRAKYKDDPGAFGTMGYDALMIMAETIAAVIEQKGEAWWDKAALAEKRQATRDALLTVTFKWTTQPFSFTKEGWPRKGQVWKEVKGGQRAFHTFQTYESFTPEGIDVLPFK
ncbi:MAG: ABC transporter substrate-binding protein [Thermodesulfobacteriota bacterium]